MSIPGPYSIHVTSKEHIVRGRHGAIIRRYPNAAKDAAMEDLRRLQRGYASERKRIHDAAPDLLEALEWLLSEYVDAGTTEEAMRAAGWGGNVINGVHKARAAIAKARHLATPETRNA